MATRKHIARKSKKTRVKARKITQKGGRPKWPRIKKWFTPTPKQPKPLPPEPYNPPENYKMRFERVANGVFRMVPVPDPEINLVSNPLYEQTKFSGKTNFYNRLIQLNKGIYANPRSHPSQQPVPPPVPPPRKPPSVT